MSNERIHNHEQSQISSLPDEILQHILSFVSTKLAIRTSLLCRRWRHVWSNMPSLCFDDTRLQAASINKTLTLYTALKMMNFHLKTNSAFNVPHIDKWIELAMSRNVENMFLDFNFVYDIPDFFYNSSSIKQLDVKVRYTNMIPRCSVSWTSLKKLSFRSCGLSVDTMAKILSGCPILESLTLYFCDQLNVLDLSTSQRLRTLEVVQDTCLRGPTEIVAPHIHCLRLRNSQLPCTLVDVWSLTEAKLNIFFTPVKETLQAGFLNLQAMVLKILEKLMHVETLIIGGNFLQVYFWSLSLYSYYNQFLFFITCLSLSVIRYSYYLSLLSVRCYLLPRYVAFIFRCSTSKI